jgi:sugar phosphate permease
LKETNQSEMKHTPISEYPYWRKRIMWSILAGYAVFYFIRKNLSVANPYIREEFGIGKEEFGAALGFASIAYGISKFTSGFLADNFSARYIMSAGLLLSALISFILGYTSESFSFYDYLLPVFLHCFGLSIIFFKELVNLHVAV